jgi:hypothetical protein
MSGLVWLLLVPGLVLGLAAFDLVMYAESGMTGIGWRYLLLPPLMTGWLFVAGVRFIQRLYHLDSFSQAMHYFMASAFSIGYPSHHVKEAPPAKPDVLADDEEAQLENLLLRIGGPGYLHIPGDTAACIECVDNRAYALGPGAHFIPRGHYLKEAVHLDERVAPPLNMMAVTRDGIEVIARDVRYRYRLATGANPLEGPARTPENPYPFSEDAVLAMAYNRTMNGDGLASWHRGVEQVVDTIITDYIRMRRLDELMLSNVGEDPRNAIYRQFYNDSGRAKFIEKGAELTWIDIGVFDTPQKAVSEQQVTNWQTRWAGSANLVRAQGEASRMAAQETARAEAQAEMLKSIVGALEEVGIPGETRQGMHRLYLMRLARLLETLSTQALPPPSEPK